MKRSFSEVVTGIPPDLVFIDVGGFNAFFINHSYSATGGFKAFC
jgi:hypothetical protein